jgi:predicted porin
MKKLLIASAALAMVAGTAQAQSSVTVYGVIDAGFNSVEDNVGGTVTKVQQIRTNGEASTSRFGLRGTEDLGGGMKANFVIETTIGNTVGNTLNNSITSSTNAVAPATGTTNFTNLGNRAFWVGLEDAKLGQVRIGLQNSFARDIWLGNDQLAAANVVGNLSHSNTTLPSNASSSAHTELNTAINYFSPRMNGVQIVAGVMQNDRETTRTVKSGNGSQFGLNYAQGKFTAAISRTEATVETAAVAAVDAVVAATSSNATNGVLGSAAVAATSVKTKDTAAAASYDFGFVKAAYTLMDRDAQGGIQRKSHAFSASFPLTPKLVGRLGYGFGDYAATPGATKYDISGMQAALNYNLSKRSTVYAIYGDEKRDTSASASNKAKEYSVGVRHSF